MAADRMTFLDPVALSRIYPSSLQHEFLFRSPGNPFSNVQLVPERISQFSISPEGVRYYKVHWQETWLAEHQLLQFQNLIETFWRSQNDLTTTQSSSTTPVNDIIKPRKETTNESFLSVLQADPVDLTTTSMAIGKSQSLSSTTQVNASSQNLQDTGKTTNSTIHRGTDILKEAVLNADINAGLDLSLPTDSTMESSQTLTESSQTSQSSSKSFSKGVKRNAKAKTINLEGFDLINIENSLATAEELEAQARETLSSFRCKRVRFPNGTSKLPQTCFFCLKTISNRKKLREHQFGVHFKNVGEFACGICQQRFVFRRQLKAHMITHTDVRSYECSICGLTCKRRSHLHKHMDTHKKERNYRCDVCHKNFKVQAELKDHCLEEHKNEISKCNVCKQTLHTAFSVYIHSMRHSGTRDHVCETCGASFKRKQHLNAHMNIHNDVKEKIMCPVPECGKEFPERQYFRKHLEIYHKDLAPNYRYDYVCTICDKDFAYKGRLDAHMKFHENETEEEKDARLKKGKVDTLSEEAFNKVSDKIEKIIDEKTGHVLMKCRLCRKREFRMIASMERHLEDHKCGRIFMKVAGNYECDVCNKSFHTESRLARHSVVHQANRRQHQCRRCKKFFKWKSCLQVHAKKCISASKGAGKRKATLKAREKLRKIRKMQEDDEFEEDLSEEDIEEDIEFKTSEERSDIGESKHVQSDAADIPEDVNENDETTIVILKVDGSDYKIINSRDDKKQDSSETTSVNLLFQENAMPVDIVVEKELIDTINPTESGNLVELEHKITDTEKNISGSLQELSDVAASAIATESGADSLVPILPEPTLITQSPPLTNKLAYGNPDFEPREFSPIDNQPIGNFAPVSALNEPSTPQFSETQHREKLETFLEQQTPLSGNITDTPLKFNIENTLIDNTLPTNQIQQPINNVSLQQADIEKNNP